MTSATSREPDTFKLSSLTLSVYLPTFLFSIGQGAVLPIVPLFALELGASVAAASLVVGMRGLGLMLFDLPSGVVVSRFGDKGAMVAGTAMVAAAAIGASLTRSVAVLAVFILIMGGGWAFWQVARLAYVSEVVPTGQLGRAMSLLGGASRVGTFVGPVLGGYLAQYYGFESALYAQAALGLAASVMMFLVVQRGSGSEDLGGHGIAGRLVATVVQHRHVFLSAGLALIALQVLRQGRQIFLPLWGDVIGLDVATIGLVYGISSLADAGLFYPMGYIMDRWGRKWASVPSLLTLSLGLLLLPVTSEVYGYALVAILMGIGNGFGAGIAMTLGADFTPVQRRGEFLGVWRFVNDAGNSGGPFLVSFITSVASLGLASIFSAGLGIAGGVVMWLLVPETLQRVNPSGIKASEPASAAEGAVGTAEPAKGKAAPPG